MAFLISILIWFFAASIAAGAEPPFFRGDIQKEPHLYSERLLTDPFTRFKDEVERGTVQLDTSGEKAFLKSLLQALKVPEESQALVFSTTSLQLSLISPRNPRALYFSEDLYVGFIPGGKIEIVSLDPALGGIFYIFTIPRNGEPIRPERAERCMNCHSGADSRNVPGLVLQSVVPAPSGGSLDAFRKEESGHQIPYDQRFGGWYVTGQGAFTNHWGNLTGRMREGEIFKEPIEPGTRFDFGKYLRSSSDILPQLLLEHQAGFVNRVIETVYLWRSFDSKPLTAAQEEQLNRAVQQLVRYIVFADEPRLPGGGIEGDPEFKRAFQANRRSSGGLSLKDFDLRERLFNYRCSYMIYSSIFTGLPSAVKARVASELRRTLASDTLSHLDSAEKVVILKILNETLPRFLSLRLD